MPLLAWRCDTSPRIGADVFAQGVRSARSFVSGNSRQIPIQAKVLRTAQFVFLYAW